VQWCSSDLNPCRCGFFGDADRPCRCPPGDPERYVRRISGPLLDRLDLRVELGRVRPVDLLHGPPAEESASVAARIARARAASLSRNGGRVNALLSGREADAACRLAPGARARLASIAEARALTARGVHRILRVARSIADLERHDTVDDATVCAAAELRDPAAIDRSLVA
jgi:magnesium chelatase family protein